MKAHWWSCVLGLLCMPAEVILSTWTVSQEPMSISQVRVNSSTKITCSTSLSETMGVYLHRGFHGKKDVVFLALDKGQVTQDTIAKNFEGRIHIAKEQQITEGHGFTWELSLLGLEDTDWYYCSWVYFNSVKGNQETRSSTGTIIIVRERDPQEQCRIHTENLIFMSVTAFTAILILFIGAVIVRSKRFKKKFRPAREVRPSRPNRPQHVCPHQTVQHCPYLITSANPLDFRGIL
ncbi:uncharacterized protein [Pagrus major]|uniref:uncharacterized protein n=1 Tax=Pagrus major TaxID=143350 RepID=UPI003CC8A35E